MVLCLNTVWVRSISLFSLRDYRPIPEGSGAKVQCQRHKVTRPGHSQKHHPWSPLPCSSWQLGNDQPYWISESSHESQKSTPQECLEQCMHFFVYRSIDHVRQFFLDVKVNTLTLPSTAKNNWPGCVTQRFSQATWAIRSKAKKIVQSRRAEHLIAIFGLPAPSETGPLTVNQYAIILTN